MAVRVSSMELSAQVADPGSACDTLESLYRDYAPSLLRLCKGRLNDTSEAEDACHESLIKASRGISRFRSGERMWPWLATIAANECIDRLRHKQREAIHTCGFSPSEIPAPEPARDSDSLNRIDILDEALRELPATYQTYIRLRLEKWSYKKIALSYGVSISAVKGTLFRAHSALRTEVKKVAQGREQWPLPALLPPIWQNLRSLARDSRDLMRNAYLRAKGSGVVECLAANAVALAVVAGGLALPSTGSPAFGAETSVLSTRSGTVTATEEIRSEAKVVEVGAPAPSRTQPGRQETKNVFQSPSLSTSQDADGDGKSDVVLEVGPVRVDCGEADNVVEETSCMALGRMS